MAGLVVCCMMLITGCGSENEKEKTTKDKTNNNNLVECHKRGAEDQLISETLKFDSQKMIYEDYIVAEYLCKSSVDGARFCNKIIPLLELKNDENNEILVWNLKRTFPEKKLEEEYSATGRKKDKSDIEMLTVTSVTKYTESNERIKLDDRIKELEENGYTCK